MEYQALGRYIFVERLVAEQTSAFAVDSNEDERTYFLVKSVGDDVERCKVGDQVILQVGNYNPLPRFIDQEQLYSANEDDVIGVIRGV